MSVLQRLAYFQNERGSGPNKALARELAEAHDQQGIREIVANLGHEERRVQSDCIKVLYEIGYIAPELIKPYTQDFLKLLDSRNNRLVWGGMIALSTIAGLAADEVYPHVEKIQQVMAKGSVITVDAGVLTLAKLATSSEERRRAIFPYLLMHLRERRAKDVAQHAEKIVPAVLDTPKDAQLVADFVAVLEARMEELSASKVKRVQKVIRQVTQDR